MLAGEPREAEVMEGVRRLLKEFITPCVPGLSAPVRCHVTPWGSCPRFRGSYSYLPPATPPATPSVLATPLGRLLMAGEATHDNYFGTVHGALETGWREAERAARILDPHSEIYLIK